MRLPSQPSTTLDELDYLTRATLTRRREHLHEPDARAAPHRALYFRPNGDADRLLAAASKRLEADPECVRALMIRASVLVKKGGCEFAGGGGEGPSARTACSCLFHGTTVRRNVD